MKVKKFKIIISLVVILLAMNFPLFSVKAEEVKPVLSKIPWKKWDQVAFPVFPEKYFLRVKPGEIIGEQSSLAQTGIIQYISFEREQTKSESAHFAVYMKNKKGGMLLDRIDLSIRNQVIIGSTIPEEAGKIGATLVIEIKELSYVTGELELSISAR